MVEQTVLVRFSHDHFGNFGTAIYRVNTPELQMADNDYATALLIDKINHSPSADRTLIFIIEDDPQDNSKRAPHHRGRAWIGASGRARRWSSSNERFL